MLADKSGTGRERRLVHGILPVALPNFLLVAQGRCEWLLCLLLCKFKCAKVCLIGHWIGRGGSFFSATRNNSRSPARYKTQRLSEATRRYQACCVGDTRHSPSCGSGNVGASINLRMTRATSAAAGDPAGAKCRRVTSHPRPGLRARDTGWSSHRPHQIRANVDISRPVPGRWGHRQVRTSKTLRPLKRLELHAMGGQTP